MVFPGEIILGQGSNLVKEGFYDKKYINFQGFKNLVRAFVNDAP